MIAVHESEVDRPDNHSVSAEADAEGAVGAGLVKQLSQAWSDFAPLLGSAKNTVNAEWQLNFAAANQACVLFALAIAGSLMVYLIANALLVAMLATWTPLGWPLSLLLMLGGNSGAVWFALRLARNAMEHMGFDRSRKNLRDIANALAEGE